MKHIKKNILDEDKGHPPKYIFTISQRVNRSEWQSDCDWHWHTWDIFPWEIQSLLHSMLERKIASVMEEKHSSSFQVQKTHLPPCYTNKNTLFYSKSNTYPRLLKAALESYKDCYILYTSLGGHDKKNNLLLTECEGSTTLRSFHWNRTNTEVFVNLCLLIFFIIGT